MRRRLSISDSIGWLGRLKTASSYDERHITYLQAQEPRPHLPLNEIPIFFLCAPILQAATITIFLSVQRKTHSSPPFSSPLLRLMDAIRSIRVGPGCPPKGRRGVPCPVRPLPACDVCRLLLHLDMTVERKSAMSVFGSTAKTRTLFYFSAMNPASYW